MISDSLKRLSKVSFTQVKCPSCHAQPTNNQHGWRDARKCGCPARKALARKVAGILRAHFTVVEEKCHGEAHLPSVGGMIDNCAVCAPRWGVVESLKPNPHVLVALDTSPCAECGGPTVAGVNSDFCSEGCERKWHHEHPGHPSAPGFASYLGSRVQHDEHGKGTVVAVVIAGRCAYQAPSGDTVECATQQPDGFTVRFDTGWSFTFSSLTRGFL